MNTLDNDLLPGVQQAKAGTYFVLISPLGLLCVSLLVVCPSLGPCSVWVHFIVLEYIVLVFLYAPVTKQTLLA